MTATDVLAEIDKLAANLDPEEYPLEPQAAIRAEMARLWYDLDGAGHRASDGVWSIECGDYATRIMALARIVGPTPWTEVPVPLVLRGWYDRIHQAIGLPRLSDEARRAAEEFGRSTGYNADGSPR